MEDKTVDFGPLFRLLDRVRREQYGVRVLAGLLQFISIVLGLGLLIVGVETLLAPPSLVRWGLLAVFAVVTVAAAISQVLRRMVENPADEEIALLVEAKQRDLHNELINAVRFSEDEAATRDGFVQAAISESARIAAKIEARGVISWRTVKRRGLVAVILVAAWAAALFFSHTRIVNALTRVMLPTANVQKIGSVRIVNVIPGDTTVIAGDKLTVEAVLEGAPEGAAPVTQVFADKASVHEEPMIKAEANRYVCDLLDIKTPRNYRVVVGDSRSRDFAIRVTERPLVTNIKARYTFPEYTGRKDETVEDTEGRIQAVRGTQVMLTVFANKRLDSARIVLGNAEPIALTVAPDGASASTRSLLAIVENASGVVEITDAFNCRNSRAISMVAVRDQPPNAKIVAPGEDRTLAVGETLELAIRGTDDFGVVKAELVEKRAVASGGANRLNVVKTWEQFSDHKTVTLHWRWKFDEKTYRNGEIVRYFVRMIDGNTVDEPGVGASAEFTVRLEDMEAKQAERKEKLGNWQAELEKVLREQKELRKMSDGFDAPSSEKGQTP